MDTSDKVGQYVLVRTHGFLPGVIRFFCLKRRGWRAFFSRRSRSRFDHVAVVVGPGGQIVEAEPGGARYADLSEYDGYEIRFSSDPLTDDQRTRIVEKARWYADNRIPYGWTDIAGLGIRCLDSDAYVLIRRADQQRAAVCSQLAAVCGEYGGATAWMCGQQLAAGVTPAMMDARLG
jgi:hypothetical protein